MGIFFGGSFPGGNFLMGIIRVAIFRVGVFMLLLIQPNSQSPRGNELHEFNSIAVIFGIYIRNSFRIN